MTQLVFPLLPCQAFFLAQLVDIKSKTGMILVIYGGLFGATHMTWACLVSLKGKSAVCSVLSRG